ncbi:MAG: DUF134 domain-containing protein [Lachnospiraceae bacterium]|nr:DUF134 domain-containing protein [Lachnospiraceae bacterium]
MPRPCKRRRVCRTPSWVHFGPRDREVCGQTVVMELDEYECIRLIDLEGLTQEQCALQMDVARTTVQAIYSSARRKLADCLVKGAELKIAGGSYALCEQKRNCWKQHCMEVVPIYNSKGADEIMKIGVTYENGQIFQHFGHTEQFKIYDVQEGKVVSSVVVDTNGSGHGALAGFLQAHQVDVLICGGIGGGAQMALAQAGIQLYGGVSGDADAAVDALLKNDLAYNPNVQCNHHGEHHHHEGGCGSHGCGEHGCH